MDNAPDKDKCTATISVDGYTITHKSCTTGRPLIDKGSDSTGDIDYYQCPDCGKNISIDYNENGWF